MNDRSWRPMTGGDDLWRRFFDDLVTDIKLFLFLWLLLSILRLTFIIVLRDYIGDGVDREELWQSLVRGMRLDVKTAGWGLFFSFALCTLPRFFSGGLVSRRLRLGLGAVFTLTVVFLFMASIPYYRQFRMVFSPLLFGVVHEDYQVVLVMLWQQYGLLWRMLAVVATTAAAVAVMGWWMRWNLIAWPRLPVLRDLALRLALFVAIFYSGIALTYGGVLSYAYDIDWENCGTTRDKLLNEATLGGIYGLYRAYELNERMKYCGLYNLAAGDMVAYGQEISGRQLVSDDWCDYTEKRTAGPRLPRPRKVVLIIAESYYNWVLLPQFASLPVAEGIRGIIARDDCAYVDVFLPNGMSTVYAVTGIVAGLPDANLYVNYAEQSYRSPYETAIAPAMKRLGYRTVFWYGGPGTWERIQEFVLAQGYDQFQALAGQGADARFSNAWGVSDRVLCDAVSQAMDSDQYEFHTVLTVSNHPPFNIDIEAEGVDLAAIAHAAPPGADSDWPTLWELGHFQYADRVLAGFIAGVRSRHPDSLVIMVGDHADRLNLDKNPSLYERYGVPFIVCGNGVTRQLFAPGVTGSHIDIAATLIEAIAPPGFTYHSLGHSLTGGNRLAFNYGFWSDGRLIGRTDDYQHYEVIPGRESWPPPAGEAIKRYVDAARAMAWWRIKNGTRLVNVPDGDR